MLVGIGLLTAVGDPGFWDGGGAVWIGGATLESGRGRQVRWHSRLWAEIKKIGLACPK